MASSAQTLPRPPARPKSSDRRYEKEILAQVEKGLRSRAREMARQGQSLTALGSAESVARMMVGAIPSPSSPWSSVVGPVYVTSQLSRLLGVSRQALADRCRRGTLLCLKTADGRNVYPACQFDDQRQVLPGLADVLQCFDRSSVDDWTLAGWLLSEFDALGGRSIIDALRQGGELEEILALAQEQADRFAR